MYFAFFMGDEHAILSLHFNLIDFNTLGLVVDILKESTA